MKQNVCLLIGMLLLSPHMALSDTAASSNAGVTDMAGRLEALELAQKNALAVPIGSVVAFAGATAPANWLTCDGSQVKVSDYPELFAAILFAHGGGPDQDTFRLPDYRGRFLRGVDAGSNRDPDRASRQPMNAGGNKGDTVGSVQDDGVPPVVQESMTFDTVRVQGALFGIEVLATGRALLGGKSPYVNESNFEAESSSLTSAETSESRPKNASVHWIIRAK